MRRSTVFRCFAIFAAISVFCAVFSSCEKTNEHYSFLTSIQNVDDLVMKKDFSGALKLLKKSEKYAYNYQARLGLYKRYKYLGEKKLAEKALKKGLKKFPGNPELAAVYGQFLLREGRAGDAEKVTKILSGTKYGSVYSEAVLKNSSTKSLPVYMSDKFIDIYKDIYANTRNPAWLVNCALIYLSNGEYLKASLLQEGILRNGAKLKFVSRAEAEAFASSSVFWALVQFDAANYDICLQNLSNAVKFTTSEEVRSLAASVSSDCYMQLDEIEQAEKARSAYIESSPEKIPDIVAVNSALWSYENRQYRRAYDLLFSVLERNPSYAPALLSYGKLAWEDSLPVEMTDLEKTVRKTTLRTEKMREFDERPRFLISDAIHRLSEIEDKSRGDEKTGEVSEMNLIDSLIVERISLFMRANSELPINAKTAEIWRTLEKNESGLNMYPSLLVYYCVQKLISYGFIDDARTLFSNYISAKYLGAKDGGENGDVPVASRENEPVEVKMDMFGGEYREKSEKVPESVVRLAFGDRVAKSVASMSIWEVELAAYFSLIDGNVSAAKRLYEFVLFESGGVVNSYDVAQSFENVSVFATPASAINLSMIYSSTGESQKALSLYGLAAGKCESVALKSKILYRIAVIQFSLGNVEQAKLSIDYSLSLDPQNAEARLFRRKISG